MGTCVTGFFALLCDAIDRNAHCPGNGRCCLTKKVEKPKKPKTTPKPAPKTNDKCPGVCIPHIMESFCTKPSTLIKKSTCQQGTVCCNSNKEDGSIQNKVETRKPATPKPPPKKPPLRQPSRPSASGGGGGDLTSLLLGMAPQLLTAATGNSGAGSAAAALLPVLAPALGGILGGSGGTGSNPDRNPGAGGGGGAGALLGALAPALLGGLLGGGAPSPQKAPPRNDVIKRPPFLRPTPPPTTTTTTTEKPDERTDCPGTCIGSYLSFTCFGKMNINCQRKETKCLINVVKDYIYS